MKIGIIGAGKVGATLGARLALLGHDVLVANSRGRASVSKALSGTDAPVIPAVLDEVVQCEVVILATPWLQVKPLLKKDWKWTGRVLVDATNIFSSYKDELVVADLYGDHGSEIAARLAPEARVVKAFNTLPIDVMFKPAPPNARRVLFVAGDDAAAVSTVTQLVDELGLRAIALGTLATAGRQMEVGGALSGVELLTPAPEGNQA